MRNIFPRCYIYHLYLSKSITEHAHINLFCHTSFTLSSNVALIISKTCFKFLSNSILFIQSIMRPVHGLEGTTDSITERGLEASLIMSRS